MIACKEAVAPGLAVGDHHLTSPDCGRRPRRAATQTLDSLKIPEALLRISTVVEVTGRSESSIRRMVAAGQFPAPVKDGLRCTRWVAQSVTNWLRKQGAK